MIEISMRDANDYVQTVVLEKENVKLHIAWNQKAYCWYVDVRDMNGNDMVQGIAIVPNLPLFNQYRRVTGLPPGELMAVVVDDTGKYNQTIGREDFLNGKFTMVYISEDEINDFGDAMETAIQAAFS